MKGVTGTCSSSSGSCRGDFFLKKGSGLADWLRLCSEVKKLSKSKSREFCVVVSKTG